MKLLLGTLYLLGILVPEELGYDGSLAQHRREVVEETVSQRRGLDAYSYTRYHPMEEVSKDTGKIFLKKYLYCY